MCSVLPCYCSDVGSDQDAQPTLSPLSTQLAACSNFWSCPRFTVVHTARRIVVDLGIDGIESQSRRGLVSKTHRSIESPTVGHNNFSVPVGCW